MLKHKPHNVVVICHSCLTGNAVWIYRGPSKSAAKRAYFRACKRELERIKHWKKAAARKKENIMRLLNDCMANIVITDELSPEQKAAAKQLLALSEDVTYNRDFYNHIMEERRRRKEDRMIRKKMRERMEKTNNPKL